MSDRSHLSIGEVLSLLQDEFPDVTISKIRFLESQGLLDPERTPSGYRKFYEPDIDQLRWILRQQRENFLPLKVIKDRLAEVPLEELLAAEDAGVVEATLPLEGLGEPVTTAAAPAPARAAASPPAASNPSSNPSSSPAAPAPPPPPARPAVTAMAEPPAATNGGAAGRGDPAPAAAPTPDPTPAPTPVAASSPPVAGAPDAAASTEAGEASEEATPEAPSRSPGAAEPASAAGTSLLDTGESSMHMTAEELVRATGLTPRQLGDLEGYGLVASDVIDNTHYYSDDALIVARTAAAFMRHGVEARHLRMYKVAAERESGFLEQLIMPRLKQRNPATRREAVALLDDLVGLGDTLRQAMLRQALRESMDRR